MILDSDLKDSRGRFLLAKGTRLDEKHLRIMKIWGVTSADIQGISAETAAMESLNRIPPEIIDKLKPRVEKIFCNSLEEHDALKELKRLYIIRFADKITKGLGVPDIEDEVIPPPIGWGVTVLPQEKPLPLEIVIKRNTQLSSFPDIYYQIVEILNDTRSSATLIADVVSKDPGLSATLLKLVNSAFYGLPTRVDSITRAIAMIGGQELSTLAMGISVIRFFKDIPPELLDMKKFWLHSIACGVFARVLANCKVGIAEERLFIAGLLHDIGRLIMIKGDPATCAYVMKKGKQNKVPMFQVEQELLDYNHAKLAGMVLKNWNFPTPLTQIIQNHHNPINSPYALESAIVLTADIMACALGFGFSGSTFPPAFDKKIWELIGLSPTILNIAISQSDRQVNEIIHAFHLDQSL